MGNISEIVKGFLWGTGFSLALLAFSTAYYLNLAQDIDQSYTDMLRVKTLHKVKKVKEYYELRVLEIF